MKKISNNIVKGIVVVFVLLMTMILMGCQDKKLTITFDTDGGSVISSQVVEFRDKIEKPEDPIKDGYGLLYWEKDGKEYDFNKRVIGSFELKAIWVITNVIFDKQKGSGGTNAVNATYGSTMPTATAPTRTDYVFSGYYDAIEGGNKYYNADMSSSKIWQGEDEITLYARWISYNSIFGFIPTLSGYTIYGKSIPTDFTLLIIPSEFNGSNITEIEGWAFSNCPNLTKIIIPNTVIEIGDNTFYNCPRLTDIIVDANNNNYSSVNGALFSKDRKTLIKVPGGTNYFKIPNGVTTISDRAFSDCLNLTNITLPSSVETIGLEAFSNCISLTNVNLPNSITTIGNSAFSNCISLTKINLPNSITTIDNNAFSNCFNLTKINLPNSITTIDDGTFSNCTSLTSIKLPNSVTTIGDRIFSDCTNLKDITLSKNITTIGNSTFLNCTSLTDIILPNNVTTIGNSAFSNCISLTSIILPNNVTTIGNSAFSNCISLTSIILPNNVTTMGDGVFSNCISLTSIIVDANNNNYASINGALLSKDGKIIIKVPETITSFEIPSSVTEIGNRAFSNCSSLTSITIPDSVVIIGDGAFSNCISLTSINIPNNVTTIGSSVFSNCISLTNINLPNSITTIGDEAFSNCISLTVINLPSSVITISSYAFYNCSSLTNIIVDANNANFTTINGALFSKDEKILIKVPETSISFEIPNGVVTIGGYAFMSCINLTDIIIPNSVTTIGTAAFSNCINLTNIIIPNSVTTIGGYAFSGNINLTSIIIPNSVTTIGNNTFNSCINLTIYCEYSSEPNSWLLNFAWNQHNRPVVWGYTGK